jgi:ABC-type Mn2+/Zn2+ transport system ATPase subunit
MAAGQARGAAALSVRAVGKVYPPASVVLRGVDLELSGSKVHGLLGANGAGKSTAADVRRHLDGWSRRGSVWRAAGGGARRDRRRAPGIAAPAQ